MKSFKQIFESKKNASLKFVFKIIIFKQDDSDNDIGSVVFDINSMLLTKKGFLETYHFWDKCNKNDIKSRNFITTIQLVSQDPDALFRYFVEHYLNNYSSIRKSFIENLNKESPITKWGQVFTKYKKELQNQNLQNQGYTEIENNDIL